MSVQLVWTFEWDKDYVTFIAPEPCRSFSVGSGQDDLLSVPNCGNGRIRFTISGDIATAECEGELCFADSQKMDKVRQLYANTEYIIENNNDSEVFSFHMDTRMQQPAQTYDRSIELTRSMIYFGGTDECNVQFEQSCGEDVAFVLEKTDELIYVQARKTALGVYINTERILPNERRQLRNGDFIFTADASFAYLDGRLLTSDKISVYDLPYTDRVEQNSHLVYPLINRTSRFHEVVPTQDIEIQDPPSIPEDQQRNLIISLLPAIGMILLVVIVRGSVSGGSMVLFSTCSMGLGAVGSVFTYLETNKKQKNKKEERNRLYHEYIDQRKNDIKSLRAKERDILNRIYIDPDQELQNVNDFTADLFDRSAGDSDFLDIRLGVGTIPSNQKIRCKKHEVYEKTDELYDLPHQLEASYRRSKDLPVIVHGTKANAVGIQGDLESMGVMMNQILLDLVARHYPADVELYCLCGVEFEPQMYAARLLPHLQNLRLGRRNIVHDTESRDLILERLFKECTVREENKEYANSAAWLVVFIYADDDLLQHPLMRYVQQASTLRVLFVFMAQHREQLPIGCTSMIRLFTNVRSGLLVNMFDREADSMFAYRGVTNGEMKLIGQKLAPVYSGETNLSSELTRSLSFNDMLGIGSAPSVESIIEHWRSADTRKSMAAPLGVAVGNKPVFLDITETMHGPHGLVAGTTGSGKSELLISYILSMAYCYSPEDVNFVIIDFKGGGTANQFEGLPHLIGTITNLSDNEIARSLLSIRAERERRQRLFKECGVKGINNINSYSTEYRAGRVKQPLPHLVIIADEFAELKAQQPEFMDELISTSRIGRSLGIHLILATQKPSGVVNEQIWSNSDFKLCLRVQSREDSNEMLRSPLAAEIREPGRAYLQVGREGIFQLFQSGYSGVAVSEGKQKKKYRLDKRSLSGRRTCIFEQKPEVGAKEEKQKTQFDIVLERIIKANEQCGYASPVKLCLPSMANKIAFKNERTSSSFDLPIGVFDRPSRQQQGVLTYNPLEGNLLVVGASQMGKTNLLQCILRASVERMDAQDIIFYILDFNTGVFRKMSELPQVGGIVMQDQEEKFKNLVKLLRQEIADRKKMVAEQNLTSFKAYKDMSGEVCPAIVVLLDNYAAYRELYDEEFGGEITYLFREGPSAGVSFCVTATRGNMLGARNLSSFSQRILLHIADVNNMSEVIEGCRRKIPETPGRGLSVIDKELLEIQIYDCFNTSDDSDSDEEKTESVSPITLFVKNHNGGLRARAIPEVPTLLTNAALENMFGKTNNPYDFVIGMDYQTVEPVTLRLDRQFELALIGKNEEGKTLFLKSLLSRLTSDNLEGGVEIYIVDHYDRVLKKYEHDASVAEYTVDPNRVKDIVKVFCDIAEQRSDIVQRNGSEMLDDVPLKVAIFNTKDAIKIISADNVAIKAIETLRDEYRMMKLLFIFGDLDNKPVAFSSPALLRQLRESRQALQFEPLSTGRMYDIDGLTVRENRFVLAKDDAFRIDDSMVSRIKILTGNT